MYNRNCERENREREGREREGREIRRDDCGHGGRGPCNPNPHNYEYHKTVATWKTVRHYKITTYDTIEPVCTEGMREDNFDGMIGGDHCGCGGGNGNEQ
ncbi:MAG: hypothetical protein FWE84_03095 [Firmicutes bacterium]|nr:hypothetical protein [Bacillota bacterium]